jgi:hypothetical protein
MKIMVTKMAALVALALLAFAAPASAEEGFSISKPDGHWLVGDWSAISGTPMTVTVTGHGGEVSLFMLKVPGGWDAGSDINLSAKLRWDAGRKAFEMWTGASLTREGRAVVTDVRKWGWAWPASGQDEASETIQIEFNSHGQNFKAKLRKAR